jgi:hypothetical protein
MVQDNDTEGCILNEKGTEREKLSSKTITRNERTQGVRIRIKRLGIVTIKDDGAV